MSLSSWAQRWSFPPAPGDDRDGRTMQMVQAGEYVEPAWRQIILSGAGHTALVTVAGDALRLGEPGDSVRVIVNLRVAQAIADLRGWFIPTAKVLDAIALQADEFVDMVDSIKHGAKNPDQTPTVSTAKMVEHSVWLDELVGGEGSKLIGGGWKDWIGSPRFLNPATLDFGKQGSVNYGYFTTAPVGPNGPFPSATAPSLRVWQPPGGRHDLLHVDVSQKFRPLGPDAWVEGPLFPQGAWMSLDEISMHPVLWELLNHDAPQPMRDPWLERCTSFDEGGSCPVPPGPVGPTEPPVTAAGYRWDRLAPLAAVLIVAGAWYGSG